METCSYCGAPVWFADFSGERIMVQGESEGVIQGYDTRDLLVRLAEEDPTAKPVVRLFDSLFDQGRTAWLAHHCEGLVMARREKVTRA